MQITDIRIRKVEKEGKMKAVVSKLSKERRVFLLRCQAAKQMMGSIET